MAPINATGSTTRASLEALHRYAGASAPDSVFLDDMQHRIDAARPTATHRDGPLRILLLGYAGAGNTGADLRAIETIRQLRRLFGERAHLSLLALGERFDHPVLAEVPKRVPDFPYLPDALDAAIRDSDVVINMEGSTYTSRFSDSLAGALIGGVALAAAHGRLGIAYGVDSGSQSAALLSFVRCNAKLGHVIARNEAARHELLALGVACEAGADTAWTYRVEHDALAGDGILPYVALCPNNPYWWPVHADAPRAFALDARGERSPHRYGPLHFHAWDTHRSAAFDGYIGRFAQIASALREQGYVPVVVGMEQLDAAACDALAARLPFDIDKIVRGPNTLSEVAAVVSRARCVVTTRYHAAVLAMSHGIPVFGLSMDSRIDRLLTEAGVQGWHASCDAPDAACLALEAIGSLNHDPVRERLVARLLAYADNQRACFHSMGARLATLVEAYGINETSTPVHVEACADARA
ncbi:MAG: polysaccharide pyruvyl transferase family protein [Paraburkholderia sp.]|uniref:polysaccharide pyruvyl transferase family protein n=3 Tax=Burkholderiales TaxID=80840 RepID=UPI0010F55DAB|nr:polysaccharide pyruvyl transferase family protein [Burkholderia sp. 4M9327F10]